MKNGLSALGAAIIAGSELLTPKVALAENKILTIDSSLIREAVECVLTAEQGKNVLLAQDYSGVPGQRRIVVINDGKRYTVDATKTYPHSYTETVPEREPRLDIKDTGEIPKEGSFSIYDPYIQIFEREDGTHGNDNIRTFSDGDTNGDLYIDGEFIDYIPYEEGTPEYTSVANTERMEADYFLDGLVDGASYPETRANSESFGYPFWVEEYVKDFHANRVKYQEGYTQAIMGIIEGCRTN